MSRLETLQSRRAKKAPVCGAFAKPSDGLEPRPPPYHALLSATARNPRQQFSLDCAVFGHGAFATSCDRLQPRGSIKAPSFVVPFDNNDAIGSGRSPRTPSFAARRGWAARRLAHARAEAYASGISIPYSDEARRMRRLGRVQEIRGSFTTDRLVRRL